MNKYLDNPDEYDADFIQVLLNSLEISHPYEKTPVPAELENYYNPVEDVSDESDDDTAPCEINIIQAQMTKIFHKVHLSFLLLVMVMIGINDNLFSGDDRKTLAAYVQNSEYWSKTENSSLVMIHLEKKI